MAARLSLETLEIHQPCTAPWDEMAGDEQRRFCTHCQKYGHNLIAMPNDEAERLVCESAGDLCVRLARDPQTQRVVTLDYRPPPVKSRRRTVVVIAAILSACGVSGSWAAMKIFGKPQLPPTPRLNFIAGGAMAPRRIHK